MPPSRTLSNMEAIFLLILVGVVGWAALETLWAFL